MNVLIRLQLILIAASLAGCASVYRADEIQAPAEAHQLPKPPGSDGCVYIYDISYWDDIDTHHFYIEDGYDNTRYLLTTSSICYDLLNPGMLVVPNEDGRLCGGRGERIKHHRGHLVRGCTVESVRQVTGRAEARDLAKAD